MAVVLLCLPALAHAQDSSDVGNAPYEWDKTFPSSRGQSFGPAQKAIVGQVVEGLEDVDGAEIRYRLKKDLKHKWNMTLGAELQFNDYLMFRTEVGFIGRTQFICGFAYRFGGMGQGLRPTMAQPEVAPAAP